MNLGGACPDSSWGRPERINCISQAASVDFPDARKFGQPFYVGAASFALG